MEFPNIKQYGLMALVGAVLYSLLKLNLFVTQAQLEQQLRLLEANMRAEYATKQDIAEIKVNLDTLSSKLDKVYEKVK